MINSVSPAGSKGAVMSSHDTQPSRVSRRSVLSAALAAAAASALHTSFAPTAAVAETRHPYLFFNDSSVWRTQVGLDENSRAMYALVKQKADAILSEPVSTYTLAGHRLLDVSRQVLVRVQALAVSWMIDNDDRYLARLRAEVEGVLEFPDWNDHLHFLDTGEMCLAIALAYDWCFSAWDPALRKRIEDAIVTNALEPGLAILKDEQVVKPGMPRWNWHKETNNWNLVCNGGLVVGALAVRDIVPTLSRDVIEHAVNSMPIAIAEYAPDGGYPEGPGYWDYATRYLVAAIASLESATGDTRGLDSSPGLDSTGRFPLHLTGPSNLVFNYYDGGSQPLRPSECLWLGKRFNDSAAMWWGVQGATQMPILWDRSPLALLWYVPSLNISPKDSDLALDEQFLLPAVSVMRSGWQDPSASFIACKGGDNTTNHAHLDQGTFVYDSDGVRWARDLGMGDYSWPGYFERYTGSRRWTYYRMRAEAHNTMVFGANPQEDQAFDSRGTIERMQSSATDAFTILELSAAHPLLGSWRRGFRLTTGRTEVLIQDEFTMSEPAEAWWFLHTRADIEISPDGKQAFLRSGQATAQLRIFSPAEASFLDAPAKPLWTSPNPAEQHGEAPTRRLAIRFQNTRSQTVTVGMRSIVADGPQLSQQPVIPLDSWSTTSADVSQLSEIRINGVPVTNFSPGQFMYVIDPPASHPSGKIKVKAKALNGGRVSVNLPNDGSGTIRIRVAEPNRTPTEYVVVLAQPADGVPTVGDVTFTQAVVASSHDGNVPENTLDGDLATRWSAEGQGQWIAYDMATDGPVDEVRIAWFNGHLRASRFILQVAKEGDTSWTTVFEGQSSGTASDAERFSFPLTTARYLRVIGQGNTVNLWNSINELEIIGRRVDLPVVPAVLDQLALAAPTTMSLNTRGRAVLTATLSDGSAADLSDATIEYFSTNPAVIVITDEGELEAVGEGSSVVSAAITMPDRRIDWVNHNITVSDGATTLLAVGDTFAEEASPNGTRGSRPEMMTKKAGPGFNRISYVKFDSPGIHDLSSVTLTLNGLVRDGGGDQFYIDVMLLDADFNEQSLTWNTRPAPGSSIGRMHFTSEKTEVSLDVSEHLADRIRDGGIVALELTQILPPGQAGGLAVVVDTRESTNPPRLAVR